MESSQSPQLSVSLYGLQGSDLTLFLQHKLNGLCIGQTLSIQFADPALKDEITQFCQKSGDEIISMTFLNEQWNGVIKKCNLGNPQPEIPNSSKESICIILSTDSLDKNLTAFRIATQYASNGHSVTLFFTFWSINLLRKSPAPDKPMKSWMKQFIHWLMPCGLQELPLSHFHGWGFGTWMITHLKTYPTFPDLKLLLETAHHFHVHFSVCKMSLNALQIEQDELIDDLEFADLGFLIKENNPRIIFV